MRPEKWGWSCVIMEMGLQPTPYEMKRSGLLFAKKATRYSLFAMGVFIASETRFLNLRGVAYIKWLIMGPGPFLAAFIKNLCNFYCLDFVDIEILTVPSSKEDVTDRYTRTQTA